MKKLLFFTITVLCFLLFGCTRTPDVPTDPSIPTTESIPETTQPPFEDNGIYFSHRLEMNRLYRTDPDGTNLTLVLDQYCTNVVRRKNSIFFTGDQGLIRYDLETSTQTVLQEGISYFIHHGDHIIFTRIGDDYNYEIHYLNPETGESKLLLHDMWYDFALGGKALYYVQFVQESEAYQIRAIDLQTWEDQALVTLQDYPYHIAAGETGVFYTQPRDSEPEWVYDPCDGSEPINLKERIYYFSRILQDSPDGILYEDWGSPYDSKNDLCFAAAEGADTLLYSCPEGAFLDCEHLGNGWYLLTEAEYIGWGEPTEYGSYENSGIQGKLFLLTPQRKLIPIEELGELGSMFRNNDFPLLDSSTARLPLTAQLYNTFVLGYGCDGPQPLCSTTHGAWLNIADGNVDLAFLAAPTPEEQAYLDSKGVEVEMKLYGGDGLVFIGNAANPVKDLTHEQILGIYRGEITNWKELGGPDEPIRAYYRDDQSGSQRLFEKLVFAGEELPDFDALGFPVLDTMSTIVNTILYDPYAIGYSIMTYLDEVYAEEELTVFSVGGVTPSPDTVKDQSYPYNTKGYLVIRSDEPADSPARRLFDWFGCPASDDMLGWCGISPLH